MLALAIAGCASEHAVLWFAPPALVPPEPLRTVAPAFARVVPRPQPGAAFAGAPRYPNQVVQGSALRELGLMTYSSDGWTGMTLATLLADVLGAPHRIERPRAPKAPDAENAAAAATPQTAAAGPQTAGSSGTDGAAAGTAAPAPKTPAADAKLELWVYDATPVRYSATTSQPRRLGVGPGLGLADAPAGTSSSGGTPGADAAPSSAGAAPPETTWQPLPGADAGGFPRLSLGLLVDREQALVRGAQFSWLWRDAEEPVPPAAAVGALLGPPADVLPGDVTRYRYEYECFTVTERSDGGLQYRLTRLAFDVPLTESAADSADADPAGETPVAPGATPEGPASIAVHVLRSTKLVTSAEGVTRGALGAVWSLGARHSPRVPGEPPLTEAERRPGDFGTLRPPLATTAEVVLALGVPERRMPRDSSGGAGTLGGRYWVYPLRRNDRTDVALVLSVDPDDRIAHLGLRFRAAVPARATDLLLALGPPDRTRGPSSTGLETWEYVLSCRGRATLWGPGATRVTRFRLSLSLEHGVSVAPRVTLSPLSSRVSRVANETPQSAKGAREPGASR